MTRMTEIVVDDLHRARFLLDVDHFVFDIETDTTPPEDSLWSEKPDKYGLSYCADVTHVSFYSGDQHPVVVFTLPILESSLKYVEDDHALILFNQMEKLDFIREVFSRDSYRAIGHNVIFDFRNLLGQLGFTELPHKVEAWDTLSMGQRLLFSEVGRSGLEHLTQKWGLDSKVVFHPQDNEFYKIMKQARKDFSKIPSLLHLTQQTIWLPYTDVDSGVLSSAMYGHCEEYFAQVDSEDTVAELFDTDHYMDFDLQETVISNLISHYVALDVVYTHRLYRLQHNWMTSLCKKNTTLRPKVGKELKVPKWPQLPQLVKRDMAISRISANQAMRGVDLDVGFVHYSIKEYETALIKKALPPFQEIIQSDIDFYGVIRTLRWYENILKMLSLGINDAKPVYSKPKMDIDHDWIPQDFIEHYFRDQPELLDWIRSLSRKSTRGVILKGLAQFPLNTESLTYFLGHRFIRDFLDVYGRQCHTKDPAYKELHLFYYEKWFRYACEKESLSVVEYISKGAFKPYFVYTVCGSKLPTEDNITYIPKLTTEGFKARFEHVVNNLRVECEGSTTGETEINPEFEKYVLFDGSVDPIKVLLDHRGFSFGQDAISFYIQQNLEEDENLYEMGEIPVMKPLALFRIQLQLVAMITRADEFLRHSLRDGKIHPLLSRDTTTGRFSSKDPNVQNVKMDDQYGFHFSGFLVAPEDFWLMECDYSNAENVMGAMISADNNFAMSTETGDFHSQMAKIYFPEEWSRLEEEEDYKGLKRLRGRGKAITFGEAYGAGVRKLAIMTKMSEDEVRQIIANKKAAYPALYAKKKEAEDKCVSRYKDGFFPAYTVLWNGARVPVKLYDEVDRYGNTKYGGAYVCWNYVQQGGVSELVSGSLIDIDDYLYENNVKTFITLNVHDSLLPAVHLEEYETVMPVIFEIMGSQVPQALLNRTCPPTHFVSEAGPENASKWGFRWNMEYPFPSDQFINQWGVHSIPEGENEAPTWRGPVHLGWSIEDDILQWHETYGRKVEGGVGSKSEVDHLEKFTQDIQWFIENQYIIPEFLELLREIKKPREIEYLNESNEVVTTGPLASEEYIAAAKYLASRGSPDPLFSNYLAYLEGMKKMHVKLGEILY